MKKLAIVLVSLFAMVNIVMADDDKPITVAQMPQAAQAFIKQHFPDSKVALAKVERDFFGKSYDVIFTNGNKLDFNKKGIWIEVDCRHTEVPAAIIPTGIADYVKQQYPDTKILRIEKDERGGYEVKLSNRWEITFNKHLNVVDIDD